MPAVTGTTRLAAVIGSPVRHSLSPTIHNAAFAAAGLDWVYLAFDVAPGEAVGALGAMRVLGIDGLSVTMPHKADVAAGVDTCSAEAERLGAVNCVVREGRRLVGHNTDGAGFVDSLRDEGVDPAGRTAAVVGAGGAARAVIAALASAGASRVVVVNRTPARAHVAAGLAGAVGEVATSAAVLAAVDIVVNATSVGMSGTGAGAGALPFDVELVRPGQVVADLVYQPVETALLAAARARGAVPVGGVGMLLHQAARAFALWTDTPAPLHAMRSAIISALQR